MKQLPNPCVGAVVIGRNEGDRLKRCLASTMAQLDTVVYVDSGSMDGSVKNKKLGEVQDKHTFTMMHWHQP